MYLIEQRTFYKKKILVTAHNFRKFFSHNQKVRYTYFDSFQLEAFEIQTMDQQENEMVVGQRQNEIVAVVLEVITLL